MRAFLLIGLIAAGGGLAWQPAMADSTERVSVDSAGNEATGGDSSFAFVSANGRFVAFSSLASNLVAGDSNGSSDAFVRDRLTGVTERVSVDSAGNEADASSSVGGISADGRFVAFSSKASNLVPGDANGVIDVFVHDRQTGVTERVSVATGGAEALGGESGFPAVSADGRFVTFQSAATNLVVDTNGAEDVFVHDRQTGVTERASVDSTGDQADGDSMRPVISADGRSVAFYSAATNLVALDTNEVDDVFVHDRVTGVTVRLSVDGIGNEGDGESIAPSISADGRFVAFHSFATNLVPGDTNAQYDIFVRDRLAGATSRVSVDSAGGEASSSSFFPAINADGRFVAFDSDAKDLVADDTNSTYDVFVHDRKTGATERLSLDSAGNEGNDLSRAPAISADGRFVAFASFATNLVAGDTNGLLDTFVRDRGPLGIVRDDLLVDFGAPGLWEYLNNGTWMKIHSASPLAVEAADLSGNEQHVAIASFLGGGLWARYGKVWLKLHNATPVRLVAGDFDGDGEDGLAVDFGAAGIWVRKNKHTWMKLHNATSQDLAVGDLDGSGEDELIVDFGISGLWARYNDKAWVKLHNASPVHIATGDLDGDGKDEVIADFGAAGLWARYNNAAWKKLHNATSQGLAIGDLDGNGLRELIVDFGTAGLWVRYNDAVWARRHNGSPMHIITADLDASGQDELVADFGSAGLWARFNDAAWIKLHPATAQALAAGGLD